MNFAPKRRTGLALADSLVEQMYNDYLRLKSLEKVGALYDRTRQSVFGLFKSRGLPLNAKTFLPVFEYKGVRYTSQKTCGRHRYLRCTRNRRKMMYLHHVIWVEHNGPIPPGHKVVFKDGNHLNVDISNLLLLTNSDQVRRGATGANQFTKTAKAMLDLLLSRSRSGTRTLAAALK